MDGSHKERTHNASRMVSLVYTLVANTSTGQTDIENWHTASHVIALISDHLLQPQFLCLSRF